MKLIDKGKDGLNINQRTKAPAHIINIKLLSPIPQCLSLTYVGYFSESPHRLIRESVGRSLRV